METSPSPATPASNNGAPIAANEETAAEPSGSHHHYTQWVLMAAAVLSYVAFWWSAEWLGIPAHRGYEGSLLRQEIFSKAIVGMLMVAGLFIGVTVIVTVLARKHWPFAGVLAASAGLFAWSFRGGPMRYVLLAPDLVSVKTTIFFTLALELLLLGAIIGFTWLLVLPRFLGKRAPGTPLIPLPDLSALQAILSQALLTGVLLILLVPTGEKKQALWGLLFAAFFATAICQHYFHDEKFARWYWVGPIFIGIIGYVINGLSGDAHLAAETGRLTGTFAALARPLPLDFASAGVLGSLMGYWIGSEHPGAAEGFLLKVFMRA